jgi:arsenate reductase
MKGILFLCVANSARSQMAEGIARAILPPSVVVRSAGSNPTSVRPEAVAVLREMGIDISGHRPKSVRDIDAGDIDTVVTLCAEEVCPVFFGSVERIHWPLSDPAAAGGTEEERLAAFRATRDELRRRIEAFCAARCGSAGPGQAAGSEGTRGSDAGGA